MNFLKKISLIQAGIGFILLVLATGCNEESFWLMLGLGFLAVVLMIPALVLAEEGNGYEDL